MYITKTNVQNFSFKKNILDEKLNKRKTTNLLSPVLKEHQETNVLIKKDSSNDGRFSIKEAAKNFLKGAISPIKTIINHPISSLGIIIISGTICSLIPILTPITALSFGILSTIQLGKNCYKSAKEYKKGNFDNAEKSFEQIGQNFINTASSIIGIKHSAKLVKEAKAMTLLKKTKLSYIEKSNLHDIKNKQNLIQSIKEIISLFTTKFGVETLKTQFKPFLIRERAKDLFNTITSKNKITIEKTNTKSIKNEFKKSPEYKHISRISDKQLKKEATKILSDIFDELGIEKEARPKLKIFSASNTMGGYYNRNTHEIMFNKEAYKNGVFKLEQILRHEATHAQEAILRSGLSKSEVSETIKNCLIDRIYNGENETIYKSNTFLSSEVITPPKLPQQLKDSFAKFANEYLFREDKKFHSSLRKLVQQRELLKAKSGFFDEKIMKASESELSEIIANIKSMLTSNPEFTANYKNYDDAFDALLSYSLSHNARYRILSNTKTKNVPQISLSPEQAEYAKQSLQNQIFSLEGNCRINSIDVIKNKIQATEQYMFSQEEVVAETNANKYLIGQLEKRLKTENVTDIEKQNITKSIEKAKLIIEHRTKGANYYRKYIKSLNNPTDKKLKTEVESMQTEVRRIFEKLYKMETIKYRDRASTIFPISLSIFGLNKLDSQKDKTA